FSKAPLLNLSHSLDWAVITVCSGSARISPRGVPWSKRMSINRRGLLPVGYGSFQALGYKVEDGVDLFPRHVELLHHFVNAQVFKVLNNRGNGQAGILEH